MRLYSTGVKKTLSIKNKRPPIKTWSIYGILTPAHTTYKKSDDNILWKKINAAMLEMFGTVEEEEVIGIMQLPADVTNTDFSSTVLCA